MKISEVQKKLLNDYYPDGYDVSEGELSHYHIMFVDIINNKGGRSYDKAVFQKYFPKEWQAILKVVSNPSYGMIPTGHNEFVVLHDPVEYAAEKAVEAKAQAEAEAKKAEAVRRMQEGRKKAAEAKVKSGVSPQNET